MDLERRYKSALVNPKSLVNYFSMWNQEADLVCLERLDSLDVEGAQVINVSWAPEVACLEVLLYRDDWAIVPMGILIERIGLLATVSVTRQLVPLEELEPK